MKALKLFEFGFFKFDEKNINSIVQFGYVVRRVLWRIVKLAFANHRKNKSFGDMLCQIRMKEDGRVKQEKYILSI